MTIKLVNAAMMPQRGGYCMKEITVDELVGALLGGFESYIGYPATAEFIESLIGQEVPVSREKTALNSGDVMIVVKLKYRVADPSEKGKFTPGPSDYEFFRVEYNDGIPF